MQSRMKSRKACALCHERKIKCDGASPSCRNCLRVQAVCRPHERRRRVTGRFSLEGDGAIVNEALERVTWLEQEIHRVVGVDIRQVRTGTPLDILSHNNRLGQHEEEHIPAETSSFTPLQTPQGRRPSIVLADRLDNVDPDISLLALNATGEVRYLGASSGSFFAKYLANVARSLSSDNNACGYNSNTHLAPPSSSPARLTSAFTPEKWEISKTFPFLLQCYIRWVHSIYPLFASPDVTKLESLSQSRHLLQESNDISVIFYLTMSMGAIHAEQTHLLNELQGEPGLQAYHEAAAQGLSAEALYRKAMNILESEMQKLSPRISLVQILNLISIYASHRASDNKQWHVGGIAMRLAIELGLHRHSDSWKLSGDECELRRRVFWTTYAIEMTLAFNLGRPPCISYEDADAPLPKATADMAMPIHHIQHRQIQEKMLVRVYRRREHTASNLSEAKQSIIGDLQDQLDRWHQELHQLHAQSTSPYPVEYWDRLYYSTSAALSRPTPLVPRPGPQAHEQCFLSSGRVIEIHDQLIRQFRLPNSWMLLQGLILSAVSTIVTARANTVVLARRIGFKNLLDNMNKWIRQLYVVMAVMRERWPGFASNNLEELLDKTSRDTIQHIIGLMTNEGFRRSPSLEGPSSRATQPFTSSLRQTRSMDERPNQPSPPIEHINDNIMHGAASIMHDGTDQQVLSALNPALDTEFLGFDSDALWGSFDTLFDTNTLQSFYGLFPGQESI